MDELAGERVDELLEPWVDVLGAECRAYRNHVLRVLAFCDEISTGDSAPSTEEPFLVAAAFHDLGIWTEKTLDYLAPSVALAQEHLVRVGRTDLSDTVGAMIAQHHKLTPAARRADPVEVFRRADLLDVTFGAARSGAPILSCVVTFARNPDAGFHLGLVRRCLGQVLRHPLNPLPMVRL